MPSPGVSAPPRPAASQAGAEAPVPELRPRAPFSRPRPPRPSRLDTRTLLLSLVLHAAAIGAVLLAPPQERGPGGFLRADAAERESVAYLEVGEWGAMAADPGASPAPAPAEALPALGAGAADSLLLRPRTAGEVIAFPERVPAGVPRPPGGGAEAAPGAGGGAGPAGARAGEGGTTGIGRLGPELRDSRLVVQPGAVAERELSDEERYQRHFADRIRAVNDSITGEADRQRRANDWTVTDRNGNRWGIDERGIVVGGRHVPTPRPQVGRPARDREDEARRERDQRAEIDRQADGIERDRHLRERARATRDRNDREREQRGQGETPP
jgi:hypothetical protein